MRMATIAYPVRVESKDNEDGWEDAAIRFSPLTYVNNNEPLKITLIQAGKEDVTIEIQEFWRFQRLINAIGPKQ